MKKIYVFLFVLALAPSIQSFATGRIKENNFFTRPWSVSSYGFLIFPSVKDADDFIKFVQTKTHAQMQQYVQDSLSGFTSLASTLSLSSDGLISAEDAPNYAMNNYRVIQTSGVIMKPISSRNCSVNYEYVLTLTPTYLNSTSYDNLKNEIFDSNSMNKFATDQDLSSSLSQYVDATPHGYADPRANDCPDGFGQLDGNKFTEPNKSEKLSGPLSAGYEEKEGAFNMRERRPFWGYGPTSCSYLRTETNPETGNPFNVYNRCDVGAYYIFWIRVREAQCQEAYSCTLD